MENIQDKIYKWAEDAVNKYLKMIYGDNNWNYGFYTQSDLRKIKSAPEYFIIQVNPGSDGSYDDQKKKKENDDCIGWGLNGHDMDAQHLIQGNFCRIKTKNNEIQTSWEQHKTWKNFQKLKSLFASIEGYNPLDDESKFILTNASFFNTDKAQNVYGTVLKTFPITLNLVDAVKPKRIIVLGKELQGFVQKGEECFDNCEISQTKIPRIYIGQIQGIDTIYIDHPSASTYKGDTKYLLKYWSKMSLYKAVKATEIIKKNTKELCKYVQEHITKEANIFEQLDLNWNNNHTVGIESWYEVNDDGSLDYCIYATAWKDGLNEWDQKGYAQKLNAKDEKETNDRRFIEIARIKNVEDDLEKIKPLLKGTI